MQNQTKFHELVKEFQQSSKEFESLLLSWESLELTRQDEGFSGRYSNEALQNAKENLQRDISFCGQEVANIALWLNNACTFPCS